MKYTFLEIREEIGIGEVAYLLDNETGEVIKRPVVDETQGYTPKPATINIEPQAMPQNETTDTGAIIPKGFAPAQTPKKPNAIYPMPKGMGSMFTDPDGGLPGNEIRRTV